MIFALLKQLPVALGRYVAYRLKRATGQAPAAIEASATPAASSDPNAPFDIGLAEKFGVDVAWPADDQPEQAPALQGNALYDLWRNIPGGSKWSQYFTAYEAVFGAIRHQPLKVLEIGVFRGSSIRLWREYFDHPESIIVGIDIDPGCATYARPDIGMHVMIGSQIDTKFLAEVVARHGPFDIILDDGSHLSAHIIATFNALFLEGLAQSGIYLAEDLHSQYWPSHRNSDLSFIDIAKQIVELMHSHYRRETEISNFWKGFETRPSSINVPLLTTQVEEVRFFDSIAVIRKAQLKSFPQIMLTYEPTIVSQSQVEASS